MQIVQHIFELQNLHKDWAQENYTIAFVPTMGNLHQGHLSLVQKAKSLADVVIVSIFVNPLQFAPHEDYSSYPRTFEEDKQKLKNLKVDVIYTPLIDEIYPQGKDQHTQVTVPKLPKMLCGIARPHFFQGVATVVLKLFNIVKPQIAIFGEKDYQQLLIIKQLVADLLLPIEIIGSPIVREADGLAMSSRNQYLSATERELAPHLQAQLQQTAAVIKKGQKDFVALSEQAKESLANKSFNTDYFDIRRQQDLMLADAEDKELIILAGSYLGKTRLIDNLKVNL